jgi:hypothetical protein
VLTAAALIGVIAAHPCFADRCDPRQRVALLDADVHDTVHVPVHPGDVEWQLTFHVHPDPRSKNGGFRALSFWVSPLMPPDGASVGAVVPTLSRADGDSSAGLLAGSSVLSLSSVDLNALPEGVLRVRLSARDLAPEMQYTARFVLLGEDGHQWNIHVRTGRLGTIAIYVQPIHLTVHPFGALWTSRVGTRVSEAGLGGILRFLRLDAGRAERAIPYLVRDTSDAGPYDSVGVSVETPTTAELGTRRALDVKQLSFIDSPNGRGRISTLAMGARGDIARGGDKVMWLEPGDLGPGEYATTLRVRARGANGDDPQSRATLVVLVRHHWHVAMGVILIGSIVGWMLGRWAPNAWQRRQVGRRLEDKEQLIQVLSRTGGHARMALATPAHTPLVAGAWGPLLRAEVLSRFSAGPSSAGVIDEIDAALKEVDLRIGQLREFSKVRTVLQQLVDSWFSLAAEIVDDFENVLRAASMACTSSTSDFSQQCTAVLNVWNSPASIPSKIIEGARRAAEPAQYEHGDSRLASRMRFHSWSVFAEIDRLKNAPDPPTLTDLHELDARVSRLVALRRGVGQAWGEKLAQLDEAGDSVDALFDLSDEEQWTAWKLQNDLPRISNVTPQAFEAVDFEVQSRNLKRALCEHPARVVWRISVPLTMRNRKSLTEGSRLVYAFPRPGRFTVGAALEWSGKPPLELGSVPVTVLSNVDSRRLRAAQRMSVVAVMISAGFAAIAGFVPQYDATFGSLQQYIALFLTAAAASGGSNVLLQASATDKAAK